MLLLVWGSWSHFDRAFDWNAPFLVETVQLILDSQSGLKNISSNRICYFMSAAFIAELWLCPALIFGLSKPIGVPLVRDAATQAAAEADNLISKG